MLKLAMHDTASTILYIQLFDGVSVSKSECGHDYFIELAFQVCSPTEHFKKVTLTYHICKCMRDDDYDMIISEIDKYLHPPVELGPICQNDAAMSDEVVRL